MVNKYSPEFREEVVRLVIDTQRPIAQVAKEIDVNSETLRNWVRRHQRNTPAPGPRNDISDDARMRELERRNAQLERENLFLKKAAAYFAKDHR